MKFGILKTKIENVLLESYKNDSFKQELKTFKKLVLENKNINRLYYIYDDLSTNKGLSNEVANDYINEMVTLYENTVNKIIPSDLKKVTDWANNSSVVENNYEVIDNLLSNKVLNLESKIQSKKIISETITKTPVIEKEVVKVPLSTMVTMANKTISNYIDNLNESEKKEFNELLSVDDSELEPKYSTIKENVVEKLETMYNQNSEKSTRQAITETIEKISTEKYDKLNYYKLKNLHDNL
jgi:succinate dehydrogenase flavin-adding protein (antitoxin of CptAB toxin-antitoxin module)